MLAGQSNRQARLIDFCPARDVNFCFLVCGAFPSWFCFVVCFWVVVGLLGSRFCGFCFIRSGLG